MNKLHFEIEINAPKEIVWDTMIGKQTYSQWTDVFMPGSDFRGSWEQGSRIVFVAPDENGKEGGMVAEVAENRPYEFISLEHLGQINDGVEDFDSDEVKQWAGAREEYTFTETDGVVRVAVDVDTPEDYVDDMNVLWPKALAKLKTLAEAN